MTLDDLLAELRKDEPQRAVAVSVAAPPLQSLAWWIVVLSKKPAAGGKPRLKFVTAKATQEEAQAELVRRVEEDAERVADLHEQGYGTAQPFRFFVIERPKDGVL